MYSYVRVGMHELEMREIWGKMGTKLIRSHLSRTHRKLHLLGALGKSRQSGQIMTGLDLSGLVEYML